MINPSLYSSKNLEWETPPEVFEMLNKEFHFTLDACAGEDNHLCENYYTIDNSCLDHSWEGHTVFMNPPYGRGIIEKFMQKAYEESQKGVTVVCLVHSRTDTLWFHDWVYHKAELRFIKGRLCFREKGIKKDSAPFPSMLAIYRGIQK